MSSIRSRQRRFGGVVLAAVLSVATATVVSWTAPTHAAGPTPTFTITEAGATVDGLKTPTDLVNILLGDNVELADDFEPLVNLQTTESLPTGLPDDPTRANRSPLVSFGRFSKGTDDLGISDGLIITANARAGAFARPFAPSGDCDDVKNYSRCPDWRIAANRTWTITGVNPIVGTGPSDATALSTVARAGGIAPLTFGFVNNTTSLTFALQPPADDQGTYLKFEYSLLIAEVGSWDSGTSKWAPSSDVFQYPDGFALFTGGTEVTNNCAVVPRTNTYLTMSTAGIVPPDTSFVAGRASASTRLAARVADTASPPSTPNGFAYPAGELVGSIYSRNTNWSVKFLTVPLTCVYDASEQIEDGVPIEVQIVIGDLQDQFVPPAVVLAASSLRWSDSPTPQEEQRLTVTRSGPGRVTSTPAGIDCGAKCSANFGEGSEVTLSATTFPGSRFSGWSGACTGTEACVVTMDQARTVGARFIALPGQGPLTPPSPTPPEPTPDPTPAPPAPEGTGLVPIDPVRVIDTRSTGPVPGGDTVEVPWSPPSGATGAVLNVTSVGEGSGVAASSATSGYLSVFPCGQPQPNVSNVNYSAGDAVPNAVITGIGANGQVCVFVSETTNLLVDVIAWFTDGFTQVPPARLLETRGAGGLSQPVAAGSVTRVRATGVAGVPATARGVAVNVTAVNATGSGYLSVYPCGEAPPDTSSVNVTRGATVANLVVTATDTAGELCVYSSAATDVLVDAFGWFDEVFHPVADTRLLDTRNTASVAAGSVTRVRVAGAGPVPATARGVAVNVTTVNARAAGFVTVYPCEATRPNTSNSNPTAGQTVANSTFIGLGASGELCIYSSVATDLLVDVTGWFTTTFTR